MVKINVWKVILTGIIFTVIAEIIHTIGATLSMSYYTNPAYFALWSQIMMPGPGAPPMSFYVLSIVFALVTAIIFALVYTVVKESITGSGVWSKGLLYGLILFLLAAIPGYLSTYLILAVPGMLILLWTLESLIIYMLGGVVIAWLNK